MDLAELRRRLREAAGDGLADEAVAPGLASMATPMAWIAQGADLDLDILPTVRRVAARPRRRPIRTWDYLSPAVAEAMETRLRPLPQPGAQPQRGELARMARDREVLRRMGITREEDGR